MSQSLSINPIKAFHDNYIWLIENPNSNTVICVDPGDATPVLDYLKKNQLSLISILITHHHSDHIGGVQGLLDANPNIEVYGPQDARIPFCTKTVQQNSTFQISGTPIHFSVLETPGHTTSHICYYCTSGESHWLFCGDTLFSGGCGRLFEGTPSQMLSSLKKLMSLPDDTLVFCAHEYTRNNLAFYKSLETQNDDLAQYTEQLDNAQDPLSLPSSIALEKKINPFIRCNTDEFKTHFKDILPENNEISIFSHLRQLKDSF